MAAHNNTDINLTRDIRTAPNHELVGIVHTSPTGSLPRVPEPAHAALEVDREALEGLQLDPNGPYTGPKSPKEEKQWWPYDFASQKAVYRDDAGLIHHEECTQQKDRRIWGFKRRTFIILVAMLGIILLCVAVGGGVSGYYANKSKDTPQPTPTPTLPEDEEPTQPGEPITSGTTGMAARPCGPATVDGPPNTPQATPHVNNPFITRGGTFEITCRRGIPGVDANIVGAVGRFTEYTFAACMNRCADMIECRGAIYGANLTDMVADGLPGGNCLLKNTTWSPTKPIELWMASAIKV